MSGHRVIFLRSFLLLNDYSSDISILRIITSDVLFRSFLSIESDLDISQYIVFKVHGYTIVRSAARVRPAASRSRASPYKI